MNNITINYKLTPEGQKAVMTTTGESVPAQQAVTGPVDAKDMQLVSINPDGSLYLDVHDLGNSRYTTYDSRGNGNYVLLTDRLMSVDDLFAIVRKARAAQAAKKEEEAKRLEAEDNEARNQIITWASEALERGQLDEENLAVTIEPNGIRRRTYNTIVTTEESPVVERYIQLHRKLTAQKELRDQFIAKLDEVCPKTSLQGSHAPTGDKSWIRAISGIDTSKANGYAFLGNFVDDLTGEPGTLLIAAATSWEGSRKRGELVTTARVYIIVNDSLYQLARDKDGSPITVHSGGGWAKTITKSTKWLLNLQPQERITHVLSKRIERLLNGITEAKELTKSPDADAGQPPDAQEMVNQRTEQCQQVVTALQQALDNVAAKANKAADEQSDEIVDAIKLLEAHGYSVIPPR